jgi:hypothetical protein
MRLAVGLLIYLSLDGLSQAQATDPPAARPVTQDQRPPTSAGPGKTTANAASPSTSTLPGASSAAAIPPSSPPNQPAAAPPENPAPAGAHSAKAAELTPEEKNLLAHGYQLETRNGANYFCRSQTTLGTRFQKKVCATAAQLGNLRQDSKDAAARAQQSGWQPTGH